MSHYLKGKTGITNLDAVRRACEKVGLSVREGSRTPRGYATIHPGWGDSLFEQQVRGKCDLVVGVRDRTSYEIGFAKQNDGTYTMHYDDYCGGEGLMDKVGPRADRFYQEITAADFELATEAAGYSYTREEQNDGRILLMVNA